jgi:DNA-binding response OmpR family regulator
MGIRILVVEDEERIVDFLVHGLREEGFTVEHAADGDLAWPGARRDRGYLFGDPPGPARKESP